MFLGQKNDLPNYFPNPADPSPNDYSRRGELNMTKEFKIRVENMAYFDRTDPEYKKYPRKVEIYIDEELVYSNKWHFSDDTEKLALVEKFLIRNCEL